MIEARGIHKAFGALTVLQGVDLDVHTGETLVILGQSGGGKSVLLKVIAGLLDADQGTVRIDGRSREELSTEESERAALRFAYLFQGAALFDSLTVGENVTFALRRFTRMGPDELRAVAEERLNWVGLRGIQDKKPAELSGGMRKRVGLARAIAMDPAYVLYDEPTTGLDPISSDAIADLILSLQARLKSTSIVVTHDMALAYKVGDRLCLLNQGRIHAVATKEAFRSLDDEVVQQFIHGRAKGPIQFL
ncbi:MAG TPA: ATP-binding cassette domain-containing protein [bacterium]|nr:ATP-binding cassette domain-containing protein [bacterium]